jgi:hypothetical protein
MKDAVEVAWEEGRRAVEEQAKQQETLRGRGALILGVASLAGTLFRTTNHDGVAAFFSALALVCFAALVALIVLMIYPRKDWRFVRNPAVILRNAGDYPDDWLKQLAAFLYEDYKHNGTKLEALYRLYMGALALLGFQVAFSMLAFWLS